jgi:hypothetical protein
VPKSRDQIESELQQEFAASHHTVYQYFLMDKLVAVLHQIDNQNAAIAAAEQDNESLKKAVADLMPHDEAQRTAQ